MNKKMSALVGLAVILSIAGVQAQTGAPIPLPTPGSISVVSGDIIQFNNLSIQSISGNTILAYPNYAYAQNGGGGTMRSTGGTAPTSGAQQSDRKYIHRSVQECAVVKFACEEDSRSFSDQTGCGCEPKNVSLQTGEKAQSLPKTKCISYKDDASRGKETACPTPPANAGMLDSSYGRSTSVNPIPQQISPEIYPVPSPSYLYRIEVSSDTRLLLRNRASATLADFASGDQINVFGFYNNDGSIRALIVRNLSKPEEKQFIQLDNAELVSVSGNTLVVIHGQNYPCYGFDASGSNKSMTVCPMGASTENPALQNIAVPETLMPRFFPSRKYIVQIDIQTIILDRNRNRISQNDLAINDKLNIYGVIGSNSDTIEADIIRDISRPQKPPERKTFEGTISQIGSDGTIVMTTSDGRTLTLQIGTGSKIKVNGILDELKGWLYNLSEITIRPPKDTSFPPTVGFGIKTVSSLLGNLGQSFSAAFTVSDTNTSGHIYSWSVTAGSIPPGLTLKPQVIYCIQAPCPQPTDTVLIEGIPTQAGIYKFTLTARDETGAAGNGTFVITINQGAATQ